MALIIAKFPIEYNPFLIDNALEGPRGRIVQPIFSRRRHRLRRRPPTVSAPRPACASARGSDTSGAPRWAQLRHDYRRRPCCWWRSNSTFERKVGRCSGASKFTIEGYRGPCAEASSPCGNVVTAIFWNGFGVWPVAPQCDFCS